MSAYFTCINDVVVGPYTQQEMYTFLEKGTVTLDTMVEKIGDNGWKQLAEFPELLSSTGQLDKIEIGIFEREEGDMVVLRCPRCMHKYKVKRPENANSRIYCKVCDCLVTVPVQDNVSMPIEEQKDGTLQGDSYDAAEEIMDGNLTCPHCWRSFSEENLLYIAVHPSLVGDPIVGEFEQKRFRPSVFNQLGQPLDEMGLPATEMACPFCHLRFPAGMMDSASLYFSIAGATSSGKSYFLTCLTHTLRDVLSRYFGASFFDLDPRLNETLSHYESQLFMPLDASRITALPATQISGEGISDKVRQNGVEIELPKPFIFDFCMNGNAETRRNLVFYDNSGELFIPGRDEWVNQATRHLSHSNGIIFLFDPTNDSTMRRQICNPDDPQVSRRPRVVDQNILLMELISRIRRYANMTATKTCDIPLVVAVCKYDVWRESFEKEIGTPFIVDSDGAYLDMNRILDISFALREMLLKYVPTLVHSAESFFQRVYFVPVSSFGTLAEQDESGYIGVVSEKISPIWIEVPFMTIMAELEQIPARLIKGKAPAEPGFKSRVGGGQIVFQHPINNEIVRLPMNYAGCRLTISGKEYDLPEDPSSGRKGAQKNPWF